MTNIQIFGMLFFPVVMTLILIAAILINWNVKRKEQQIIAYAFRYMVPICKKYLEYTTQYEGLVDPKIGLCKMAELINGVGITHNIEKIVRPRRKGITSQFYMLSYNDDCWWFPCSSEGADMRRKYCEWIIEKFK